jgi:hypothetical protein
VHPYPTHMVGSATPACTHTGRGMRLRTREASTVMISDWQFFMLLTVTIALAVAVVFLIFKPRK